ncbi:JMJD8 isoform 14, partial [Pongo abelii]
WTCPSRSTWSSCCTPRTPPPWAMTPCTSSGTTTSPSGPLFFGTTPHPHLACWEPLQLTALESQELARGCPSIGMGPGTQR